MALKLSELDGTNGFRLDGIDAYDSSGRSVAGAGDVNGDGIDDLIIGAEGADPGGRNYAGESYVVFGTAAGFGASLDLAGLDGTNGFRLEGIEAYDGSGASVAGAGDVNGDGIDDLVIGAPRADPGGRSSAGESYVVFGSSAGFAANLDLAGLDGTDGFRLDGIDAYDNSGYSVAGAGDVNGDGIDDLIIGAFGADPGGRHNAGESYVVFGSSAGFGASLDLAALDGTNGFRLGGINEGDNSGVSVAGAGDVNGDGIDDLVVGAPFADPGDRYDAGESYVVFGSSAGFAANLDLAGLDGTNGFRLDGIDAYDVSGSSVAGAGDVNGDGIDDLIVAARYADPGDRYNAGESYVVFGTAAGFGASLDLSALDGTNGFRLEGIDSYDISGFSVAGAGDVNGDGIDDLIIGAPLADPDGRDAAGESYVVFGSAAGFAPSLDLAALDGKNGFRLDGIDAVDTSGWSVAGAGNVNGDGIDDLVIGAPYADPAGEGYVVFGFRSVETGTTMASVAASSDDAEQSTAAAQIQLGSQELEIGQTAKKLVGLRFTGLDIPDGATVTEAYIEFEAARSDARASQITIALEDSTDAATYGRGAGKISARPYLEETTSWAPEPWVEGGTHRTADLAATIAALIGTDGLDPDEALAFRFTGTDEREAASFDSSGAAPKLVIEFETGPPETLRVPFDDHTDQVAGFPRWNAELANDFDPDADSFRFASAKDGAFAVPWDESSIM